MNSPQTPGGDVVYKKTTIIEETIEFIGKEEKNLIEKPARLTKKYFEDLGPGLTTGAADDDPSGIATYSQTGAQFGFSLAWMALFTMPFMAIVEEMCARIGLVTGEGLAANIRKHYSKKALYGITSLLFIANTFNIAADIGAMAAAMKLLLPTVPFLAFVVGFGILCVVLQIFIPYARYAKYLKYMTFSLLAYIVVAFLIDINWATVAMDTLIPSITFSKDQLILISAIFGTTISPYLFFWQTSQEVEEKIMIGETSIAKRKKDVDDTQMKKMRTDVWSGMFFSNLIMFFIIITCGATLYVSGITEINTADQAAQALRPIAGKFSALLFALGIVGTGLLAVPVLAGSTAYAVSESFSWRYGLYRKFKQAKAFYGVIIISVLIGVLIEFFHFNPIRILIYSALVNGLITPFILFFIIRISGNKHIMGAYKSGISTQIAGWSVFVIMKIANTLALIAMLFW